MFILVERIFYKEFDVATLHTASFIGIIENNKVLVVKNRFARLPEHNKDSYINFDVCSMYYDRYIKGFLNPLI